MTGSTSRARSFQEFTAEVGRKRTDCFEACEWKSRRLLPMMVWQMPNRGDSPRCAPFFYDKAGRQRRAPGGAPWCSASQSRAAAARRSTRNPARERSPGCILQGHRHGANQKAESARVDLTRGTATVLVEVEPAVRELAVTILASLGYRVLNAPDCE